MIAQFRVLRVLIAATAFACATQASAEHLYPRDECGEVEGAGAFRMSLVTAVANRELEMLKPLVSDSVHLDFGGGSGWQELASRLEDRDLWAAMDDVLSLGCAYEDYDSGAALVMPWIWSQDTGMDDPFSAFVAKGWVVPMHSQRSADAPLIRNLNWESVEMVEDWEEGRELIRVRTCNGEEGYVALDQLRHELDYRMIAERRNGRWQVVTFIAGD